MKKKTRRASFSPEQWKEFINGWQRGRLPGTVYCEQKNLNYGSFCRWKKHFISLDPTYRSQTQKYTLDQWREILSDWKKSGMSANAYCVRKRLSKTSFYKWQKRIEGSLSSQSSTSPPKESSPKLDNLLQSFFVPVTENAGIPIAPAGVSQKLEVVFAQGHRLCLNGPFDWEKLSSWLTPLLTDPRQEPIERMDCCGNKNELS